MFVLIVGGGKVGLSLAQMLWSEHMRVRVIEVRPERVEEMAKELPADAVVYGNGTDPLLLEKAGILDADVVAAVTGEDETNLVVTNLARIEFGVRRTIARVNNPKNAWLFSKQMGVDVALNEADLIAHLIREEMSLGDMTTLLKLRQGAYSLAEEKVHPTSIAVGKAIRDLKLPQECVFMALIRRNELVLPHGDTVLEASDEVLAVVHETSLTELDDLLGPAESEESAS